MQGTHPGSGSLLANKIILTSPQGARGQGVGKDGLDLQGLSIKEDPVQATSGTQSALLQSLFPKAGSLKFQSFPQEPQGLFAFWFSKSFVEIELTCHASHTLKECASAVLASE